jgi:hypothetical protein
MDIPPWDEETRVAMKQIGNRATAALDEIKKLSRDSNREK